MYSAMILYNDKLNKDISHIIKKNDSIFLLNNKNIMLKLEYISNESDNAILVPTDEYNDFYEKIEEMNKPFNEKLKAYYIGTFDIEKCK
jgi:hypothetical protein